MSIAHEAKVVVRSLRHRPGMVLAILLTLALGIGVNTAVFTLVEAVLLRPLDVKAANELVAIYFTRTTPYGGTSLDGYDLLRSQTRTLSSVAAYVPSQVDVDTDDGKEGLSATFTAVNYFTTLGIQAAIGRTIVPADSSESPDLVVISAALWRSHFAGDPKAVGKRIGIRGVPMTIVGVMPEGFHGTDLTSKVDVWMPLRAIPLLNIQLWSRNGALDRTMPFFSLFGRLASKRAGSSVQAEVEQLTARLPAATGVEVPPASARKTTIMPLARAAAAIRDRNELVRFFRVIVLVAALTLLLTCMNIGNLLVIRARERSRDLGVRLALGASGWQVARQVLVESGVLALMGGLIGVLVAIATLRALSVFTLPGHIALDSLALQPSVSMLVFAVAASLVTALIFGASPAIAAARADVLDVLNERELAGAGGRRRQAVIAFQVAASLVVLVSASLLLRTIGAALGTAVGFPADRIAAVTMTRQLEGRYLENLAQYEAVVAQLERTSGIDAAAVATHVPLAVHGERGFGRGPAPTVDDPTEKTVGMGLNFISKDYFKVMDLPIVAGRAFGDMDRERDHLSVILNESAAKALWPGESALGKIVHAPYFLKMQNTYEVIGVVRDSKYAALQDEHVPYAYVHLPQVEPLGAPLTILARGPRPHDLLATIQRTVKETSPALRVAPDRSVFLNGSAVRVVSDQIKILVAPQRFGAALLSGFAVLALLVCAVGIYGNVAYVASRRTTEIGVRMALGASARAVLALVLTDVGVAVGLGLIAGVVVSGVAAHALEKLLFGVPPIDVPSFVIGVSVTVVCALGAAFVPSVRSVRIDPALAMRTPG